MRSCARCWTAAATRMWRPCTACCSRPSELPGDSEPPETSLPSHICACQGSSICRSIRCNQHCRRLMDGCIGVFEVVKFHTKRHRAVFFAKEDCKMGVGIEALFTSALGLQEPWSVEKVELDTARRRIEFELTCKANRLTCPHCQAVGQGVHDRLKRQWRHLDFFQYEAWLHAQVPRIACTACGKTAQREVPWAREGSGFTALFEALALSLCQTLPVRQAAALLRCSDKQLWRRIEYYVTQARALDDMSTVRTAGIDETRLRQGHNSITVVHDLDAKRLLFACEGRDHQSVVDFAADLQAHAGDPAQIEHVCQEMSAAYAKGVALALPDAQISYDRFHVIAMANEAMDGVRRQEMSTQPQAIKEALGDNDRKLLKSLAWGMRRNRGG